MKRRKIKPRSHAGNDKMKTALWIILALAIVIIFYFVQRGEIQKRESINQESFCAHDLKESIIILIDHSDKLSVIQKAALQARLWDIVENLPKNYSQIKVFSADKINENVLAPELVLCNPGSEKEMSRFTENQKIVRKHYEEKFRKHLDEILNAILNKESAAQSPIMETVQSVAVTSFIGEKNKRIKKKLILVSDLLQHTSDFSVYGGVIDFERYKSGNHWKSVKSDLNDVEVELYFLHRDEESKLQNSNLRDFWIDFFEGQGAKVTRFLPIEG